MEDISQLIANFMGNEENVAKLQGLTQMLQNQNTTPSENEPPTPPQDASEQAEPGISPDMMQKLLKFMPLLSSMGQEDENSRLLKALRPHLSEPRQEKLDKSMKILKLVKILPALKGQELF